MVQFITQKGDEIADSQLAKSPFAKQSLTDELEGFPGIKDYTDTEDVLNYQKELRQKPLSELAQQFNPESMYGAQGVFSTPLPGGALDKKPNVISEMEKEIIGQTNVANPFDLDISDIGTGLRGFAAAGGGIAKEAGDSSGPPPERGPMSQGLQGLMKRVRNL